MKNHRNAKKKGIGVGVLPKKLVNLSKSSVTNVVVSEWIRSSR